MLGKYGAWLAIVLTISLCVGCGGTPEVPVPSCQPGSCPSGSECVDGKYCITACGEGLARCNLACTDLQFDRQNCGACGTSCKTGEVCTQGTCKPIDAAIGCSPACPTGQTCEKGVCVCPQGEVDCGGSCIVLATSSAHCGACGNACKAGATCLQGKCSCSGGQSYCGGACVDTNSTDQHCGSCGNACGAGFFCDVGKCVCTSGKTDCSGTCVDTNADTNHCGACGTVCLRSQSCNKGQCVCSSGFNLCGSGANASCVNLKVDPKHCGTCGKACSNKETCLGGKCVAFQTCSDGKADCGGTCVDLNADSKNCGSCGSTCSSGENCVGGTCKIVQCKAGEVQCGNLCVNLDSNSSHCGGCFNSCLYDHRCTNRQCVPLCPKGQTACNGSCVDLQSSSQHCGACGKACGQGSFCKQGKCTSYCTGNLTACASGCVNLLVDPNNCGRCGTSCDSCNNGKCECGPGKVNCNDQCAALSQDHRHCGACFKACPNGLDCENSACGTFVKSWYPDLDGDGFGDKNAKPFVGGRRLAPSGWVTNNKDCCDADPEARPGQLKYFSKANKCKNFDYNCDGKEAFKPGTESRCACSKTHTWKSSTFSYTGLLQRSERIYGTQTVTSVAKTVTFTKPKASNSCEFETGDITFTFAGPSFTLTDTSCKRVGPQAVFTSFTHKSKFPVLSGKPHIKWLRSAYKNNCLFNLSGAAVKCGDNPWHASGIVGNISYSIAIIPRTTLNRGNPYFCWGNRNWVYHQTGTLSGSFVSDSQYGLTAYPTKRAGALECQ